MTKNCFKTCRDCGETKPLSDYYTHPQMADGHLNKCKKCVKERIHRFWAEGRGKEVDKKRGQKPARKEWQRQQSRRMKIKHAAKNKVRSVFWCWFRKNKHARKPCAVCGTKLLIEAHHSDYTKPLEVIWLCCYHHKEWHRNNEVVLPLILTQTQ